MTKFLFCISYFSWSEIIGFGIEGDDGRANFLFETELWVRAFRSILIMLDFGLGKLNPPDAKKKELVNFFFFAGQVCTKTFAFCDYVGLLQLFSCYPA